MKSLSPRQSATSVLVVLASILASFLIGSVFAESASTQALTNADSDLLPRFLAVSNGKIAFGGKQTVGLNTREEVFVMDPDGSNETAITLLGGIDPSYSPDGTKIVFTSGRDNLPNEVMKVYVMNADGSNQGKLTNDANDEQFPSWSPDGTKIVFNSSRDDLTGQNAEIYVMDANGSNQIRLTDADGDNSIPSYSPDGTKIVFNSNRTGNYHVFIMNADGSSETQLSTSITGKPDEGVAAWSPDGSKIAHIRGDVNSETSFEIFVMNADGSNPVALTNNAFGEDSPTWSPDGAKLAFVGFPTDPTNSTGSVFTMDANGSNQVQLTDAYAADGRISWQSVATTPPPSSFVQFSASTATATETLNATTKLDLTVTRTGNTSGAASVNYASSDGTANERSDYLAALGTLRFQAGETAKTIAVFIVDDSFGEAAETFDVTLSNPVGCSLGAQATITVTINSNEAVNGPNPVRDASFSSDFFVRQHYVDFFNREADAPGLAFWKNQIDECTTQECREIRRINVSAAFFLSIEFQQTGYLVYKANQAAFNSGEQLELRDFLPDTQEIGRGVIIGQPGAEQQLETNKQNFFNAFVQRAAFLAPAAYPTTLTAAQFVDKLNGNTLDPLNPGSGPALTPSERDALVAQLLPDPTSPTLRAQVLRSVSENGLFNQRQFNKAFVLMQYFGYLRRNPDATPDTNFDGYNFWLAKLNQFNGNFVNAEMVKAFIISGEYIQRFGP